MSARRARPQSLRALSPKQRYWFWGLMCLGAVVIGVGWYITIRQFVHTEAPQIRGQIDEQLQKVTEEAGALNITAQEKKTDLSEAIDLLKAGYEQERLKQEESETTQIDQP